MARSFDIVALAKRVNQRREEWNRLHPGRAVQITPAMSRILENDPEYIPARRRNPTKRRRAARNPSIGTLVQIAAALGTTVGDLLGETGWQLSDRDAFMLRSMLAVLEKIQRGRKP